MLRACTSRGVFMYFVFTRMPGECYRRRLRSLLLCLCDVFRALINSLVCCSATQALWGSFCFGFSLCVSKCLSVSPCLSLPLSLYLSPCISLCLSSYFSLNTFLATGQLASKLPAASAIFISKYTLFHSTPVLSEAVKRNDEQNLQTELMFNFSTSPHGFSCVSLMITVHVVGWFLSELADTEGAPFVTSCCDVPDVPGNVLNFCS